MPLDLICRRTALAALGGLRVALAQSLPADPLAGLRRDHPRLVLTDGDLSRVRALVHEYPPVAKLRGDLQREGEKLWAAPPVEYKPAGPRLLTLSRRAVERIYLLGLLWRLDANHQHADRALKELRAIASFRDWNPAHFIDTAEMAHALAIGYDWFYPLLSPEDRALMRTALVEKALTPALSLYQARSAWTQDPYHWNLVCNSGIGIAALAIADEERDLCAQVFRGIGDSLPHALATYAPDGSWPEGPGFWHFATRALTHLLSAVETALDVDMGWSSARGFDRTGRCRVYSTGPSERIFNFGDSSDEAVPCPELYWLARRFSAPVYAWQAQRETERAAHPDPLDLIWFYKEARSPQAENWPLDALFVNTQTAYFRSAWDETALFVAAKGGDNKEPHAHLDLGSFVLDAGGQRWALDLGGEDPGQSGYAGKPRFSSFRTRTGAHSTMLLDDESQDRHAEARIVRHAFGPDLSWAQIDLSRSYPTKLKQHLRRIGLVQRQAVLIEDVLTAELPVEFLWGMMTDADVTFHGQTAELTKGSWTLSAEIRTPRHAVFDVIATPNAGAANVKKLVVRLGPKMTELNLSVLLTPHRTGQPKPRIDAEFPR